ncbi:FAD:protein FMN transferase [Massilia sp. 9096]|uniref:FAD:protein FMN transferase n=1 Tax=Massilia sp. 9096 TaxID=1500894 RepID=UPI0005624C63|nr:FAD:protein FMN transferase [Massilia sp. 9096]
MRAVLVPLDIDPGLAPAGSRQAQLGGSTMGTRWSARLMLPPGVDADLDAALQAELDEINAQMSHWAPDSLLSRYNTAPAGSWHALPPQFHEVIDYALQVARDSGGAYDPAAGDLVDLWGFGPGAGANKRYDQAGFYAPSAASVAALLARRARTRACAHALLDGANRRLLQPGGVTLDLSAVAKGYAVDRLALCLERHGVRHYLVEIGGELRGAGVKGDGQPWWVEVEGVPDADGAAGEQPVVALHGLAIATSGDYRRYFQQARRRVPHTLDPRTGQPVAHGLASVTVLASTCMQADALSTAITVLGPQAGMAFAERRAVAARFLLRRPDGGLLESASPAWRAMLQ